MMTATGTSTALYVNRAPQELRDLGIRASLVQELALKTLYVQGEITIERLSDSMKISRSVCEELFQRLRKDQLCEVTGMVGVAHRFICTGAGRTRAIELLNSNSYCGPVPVSLEEYTARVQSQGVRGVRVSPDAMEAGFSHLVVAPEILAQLGTALNSGRAIFLYGPTGTGKTTFGETLADILHTGDVWIPYAIEVDGQIITVFDDHTHRRSQQELPEDADARWVLCQRPRVAVGGELSIDMLDLQFNAVSKFYNAPLQMKANNGLLLIDDFGRQRMSPVELLNRWVVPLDRSIDFLSLYGGKKIEVPFDVVVVFATNLEPSQLVDEAFLRRIQTKIKIGYLTSDQFRQVFSNVCAKSDLIYDVRIADEVMNIIQNEFKQPLRGCHPRDVVDQILWAAKYEGRRPVLTREAVRAACHAYFIEPDAK